MNHLNHLYNSLCQFTKSIISAVASVVWKMQPRAGLLFFFLATMSIHKKIINKPRVHLIPCWLGFKNITRILKT